MNNVYRKGAGGVLVALVLALSPGSGVAAEVAQAEPWFSAWTVSHGLRLTSPDMTGSSVRMIVRPTASGQRLRVKLENTMGESPVAFSAAYVGRSASGPEIVPGSNAQLTFSGAAGLSLGGGEGAYSDALDFQVRAFEKLTISLDVARASDISAHQVGLTTNYFAARHLSANEAGDGFTPVPEFMPENAGNLPFYWLASVDVLSPETTGTIVLFGDSITDGRCSTRDENGVVVPDLYQRWGDILAERLSAAHGPATKAIANQGIAGNRVLIGGNGPPGLERLDRDVLDRAGATHVVFFEGTNDIAGEFAADQIISGMQEIIDRVHAAGMKIFGVTIIPRGRPAPLTGWTDSMEQHRVAVNAWIRTQADFDGVIDFAALMQHGPLVELTGGGIAETMPEEWNCDNTHPNAAGYAAMGEFIDLALFET